MAQSENTSLRAAEIFIHFGTPESYNVTLRKKKIAIKETHNLLHVSVLNKRDVRGSNTTCVGLKKSFRNYLENLYMYTNGVVEFGISKKQHNCF